MINSKETIGNYFITKTFAYSVSSHGPLRLESLSFNRALIEATAASIIFSCSTVYTRAYLYGNRL